MLYSLALSVAMISGVLSVSRVTFSTTDNFDSYCNSDTSLSSYTPEDPLNDEIYYCIYNDDLAPNTYYRRFYNSNGDQVDYAGYNSYSGSSNTQTRKVYSRRISYIDTKSDTYTFRFESQDSSYVACEGSIYLEIIAEVTDISVRTSYPTVFDDYYSNAEGSIGDGETLVVEGSNDIVYFSSVYALLQANQRIQIIVKGVESHSEAKSGYKTIDEDQYLYGYMMYTSMSRWSDDNHLDITSYIYDSELNMIDSYSIRISLEGNEVDETQSSVYSVYARLSSSSDIVNDGEVIHVDSLHDIVYYCSSYSDVISGQYFSISITGDVMMSPIETGYMLIDSTTTNYGYCYGYSLSSFSYDNYLTIESKIYTSNKVEVDSKSITISYKVNEEEEPTTTIGGGYCQEKEGTSKPKCANKTTEQKCLDFSSKCEWIQ